MNRAIELLIKYGGKNVKVSNVIDVYPRPRSPYFTGVSLKEINNLLGVNLNEEEVKSIFDKLGFEYEYLNTKDFVVNEIKNLLGKPHNTFPSLTYDAPNSFDCSTLTAYVFAHAGKSIPRLTIDQLFFGKEIIKDELEPGDLIFSNREEGEIRHETINFLPGLKFDEGVDHVGMYIGDDTVIHTSRYKGCVVEEKLSESDNFKKIVGYRRIVEKDENRFAVKVPYLRLDIKNEVDLIEEVGRIYGYENISPKEVSGLVPVLNSNQEASAIFKIKSILQELGFWEVQTYSFSSKGDLKVVKALASDKEYLRVSLEEGVLNTLQSGHYNADLIGLDRIQVFEIGKVYPNGVETLVLGLGVRNKNFKKPKTGEILRNTMEEFHNKFQTPNPLSTTLGTGKAQILDEQEFIQIDLTNLIDQIKIENKIEINFNKNAKFEILSSYPFMSRDISVWIPNGKGDQNTIFEIVEKYAGSLLKTKRLFDVFEKEGRTSFAVRVVFQSNEKTLNDEEVGEIMNKVYEELKSKEGFEIR
jgi:phenylalanyl-tRNA synthetase beta subunit